MKLNTIGEDGCPCGEYNDGKTYIKAHCWRTYYYDKGKKCNCDFAGVHYKGDLKTAKKIAKQITNSYNCDVNIVKLNSTLFNY